MSSSFLDVVGESRLYPITDRKISGLSHAEQVAELGRRGARIVQLREKSLSPVDFYREAAAAIRVAHELDVRVIVNDRVDIALALGADGVHLGQDDLPPDAARRLLGNKAIIGFSTHNPTQAALAKDMPVDYIALGPIFATSTKIPSDTEVGLSGIVEVRKLVDLPIVAIGGITSENNDEVLLAGADVVAIISDLWRIR